METLADPLAVAASTNTSVVTETWDVVFYEAHAPSPPGEGQELWGYRGRSIADDPTYSGEKWLYVCQANLDADGRITRTSLLVEGQYDADGALTLVDWALPAGHERGEAHPLAGRDVREPTVPRPDGRVRLSFRVDGSATGRTSNVGPPPGGRSVYLAFLSHVQLPAARLDLYFGERADQDLLDRALLLDPSDLRDDGTEGGETVGYGPSAADALRRAGKNWITATRRDGAASLAQAVLVDHVALAGEIHRGYEGALGPLLMYDLDNASKTFHASTTRSVAEAYAAAKTDRNLDEVPGQPLVKIREFEGERTALMETVELWAQKLYWDHMRQPGYRLARADAADAEGTEPTTEEEYLRIEDEAERQLNLLDGAELSDAGKRYLIDEVGDVGRAGWFTWFAKSEAFLAKLAAVPTVDLRYAFKDPWAKSREIVKHELGPLNARRVGLAGDLTRVTEHARAHAATLASSADRLRRIQCDVLAALTNVETDAELLGRLQAMKREAVAERAANRRRFRQLLVRGQADLAPGVLLRTTDDMVAGGEVRLFDPRSLRNGRQSSFTSTVRTFRFEGADYVQRGSGLYALADADRLIVGPSGQGSLEGAVRSTALEGGWLDEAVAHLEGEIGKARRAADASRQRHGDLSAQEVRARTLVDALTDLTDAKGGAVDKAQGDLDALDAKIEPVQARVDGLVRESDEAIEALVTSPKAKLAFGLSAFAAAISAADFARKMTDDKPDAWGVFDEAFVSAVGAVGGAASATDATEMMFKSVAYGVRNRVATRALVKGLGAVGGVCSIWVGYVEVRRAGQNKDKVAMVSAWAGIASGAFAVVAGVGAATAWLGPGAVATMGLAAILAGLFSVFLWFFTDSPLETWFKTSRWSAGAPRIGPDSPALRQRMQRDLTALLELLSMPAVSVELWDAGGLAAYGSGARREGPPPVLRLAVRPGFRTPGMTYRVTDLRLRVARTGPDLDWRLQRPGTSLSVPDTVRTLYTPADGGSRAVYVQEFGIDYGRAPGVAVEALRDDPHRLEFLCAVALVTPGDGGPDVSFRLRGDVGHSHRTDRGGYTGYSPFMPLDPTSGDGPHVSVGVRE